MSQEKLLALWDLDISQNQKQTKVDAFAVDQLTNKNI